MNLLEETLRIKKMMVVEQSSSDNFFKEFSEGNFNNLKEFSENASHEMQTPLAIMQSKVELLLQSSKLTKDQVNLLQSIYQAGQKLSKLNKLKYQTLKNL